MTAFNPEPHTLLIVVELTSLGRPALRAAWRAGACPRPAPRTSPMMTSSMSSFFTPDLCTASFTAILPRSVAGKELSAPLKLPIGVRAALTITGSYTFATSVSPGNELYHTMQNKGKNRPNEQILCQKNPAP